MGFKDMEKSKLDAMKNQWDEEYKKFKAMKLNLNMARGKPSPEPVSYTHLESLNTITYEGSLADWNAVKKNTNWDSHAVDIESPLSKIQCLDGYMEYVANTKTWKEVKE